MAVSDYKTVPDQNTTISGINIAEGCPPSGINNAIRQMMADIKSEKDAKDAAQTAKDAAQDKSITALSGDIAKCVKSVNEKLPDDDGNVNLSGVPVGTIIWSAVPNAPHGFLVCDGSIVGRGTYPELFAAIGTKYGEGDGSTTFALPNLIGKVAWGDANVGIEKAAGLPNITGYFALVNNGGFFNQNATYTGGAIFTGSSIVSNGLNYSVAGSGEAFNMLNLDASRSSSIYGNSNTVQPPALTLLPCIKAYEAIVDDGSVVVSELARDVDRKVEVVESGDGYVRYDSGLQMCWGVFTGDVLTWVPFPLPFKNNSYSVSALCVTPEINSTAAFSAKIAGKINTGFSARTTYNTSQGDGFTGFTFDYIAVGYWR